MESGVSAQANEKLIGTWKLVSVMSSTSKGERHNAPYGEHPVGFLTYSGDGRVSAMISYDGRKPLPVAAGAEEQAQAFKTFLAYAGCYALSGDKITHSVEISSIQAWVGKDLVRFVRFEADRMTLITPPTPSNGKLLTYELVWQRLGAG